MRLRRIPFDDITPGEYCLSDASTIADLADSLETLSCPLDTRAAALIRRDPDYYDLRASLLALERWVVTETLIVDAVALDSIQQGAALAAFRWQPSPWLRGAAIDLDRETALLSHLDSTLLETTESTGQRLTQLQEACHALDVSTTVVPFEVVEAVAPFVGRAAAAVRAAQPELPWDEYGFGIDKRYAEVLDELYGTVADMAARSTFGVERTLYYYELAAAAQIPLILHPRRRQEALHISNACRDAYDAVKTTLRSAFEEPMRQHLTRHEITWNLPLPPLSDVIVRRAGEERASILSIAKRLKESKNAVEFREWISDIQRCLAENTAAGAMRALKDLSELNRIATSWATALDVEEEVTHRRRRLDLSWVPRVGVLLQELGGMSVDDPILTRKGYLTFISMWYQSAEDGGA